VSLRPSYDKETGTGGSNGATMRFPPEGDHGANAGLKAARDFLEPIKGMQIPQPFSAVPFGVFRLLLTRAQKSSHGSPIPISGSSPAYAPFKKCKVLPSPGALAAKIVTLQCVLRMAVCRTRLRIRIICVPFSAVWDLTTARLLL
jgi:hypothetical protein